MTERKERWDYLTIEHPRGRTEYLIIKERIGGSWSLVARGHSLTFTKPLVNVLNRHGPAYVLVEQEQGWEPGAKHPHSKPQKRK